MENANPNYANCLDAQTKPREPGVNQPVVLTEDQAARLRVVCPHLTPADFVAMCHEFGQETETALRLHEEEARQHAPFIFWAEPARLLGDGDLAPLPPCPVECLPPVLRDMVVQAAACFQVPLEACMMAALTVAGFSMGNRTRVPLKRGVSARPNLYTLIVMPSGERKSSVYKPMTAPLDAYARRHRDEWKQTEAMRRIHEMRRERIEKELAKMDSTQDTAELERELECQKEPTGTSKSFLSENATEEALIRKMADCGERAAVFSADARDVLQVLQGLYNKGQNRDSLLVKAYDGDSVRILRMGRETWLGQPSVSLLLFVQHDKLRELGANAGLYEGGFVPRLLFCIPDSLVGERTYTEAEISPKVEEAYGLAIQARLEKYADQTEDFLIALTPEAKAMWIERYNRMEREMAKGGDLAGQAAMAARWQTLPLRIAAIITEYCDHGAITDEDMRNAIVLSDYMIAHGQRAAEIMGKVGASGQAVQRIARKILDGELVDGFTARDIKQKDWNGLRKAEEVEKALTELALANWIAAEEIATNGRPKTIYHTNPAVVRNAEGTGTVTCKTLITPETAPSEGYEGAFGDETSVTEGMQEPYPLTFAEPGIEDNGEWMQSRWWDHKTTRKPWTCKTRLLPR